jgi:membrane protein DedA with SNARE-associated domain
MIRQLLDLLGEWSRSVMLAAGYPGLVFVMILENVFPPIPSEVVLPLAGSLSQGSDAIFILPLVILAGGLGSVLGALVLYAFGAWARTHGGRRVMVAAGRFAFLTEADFDKAEAWFARYRGMAVFICRFVPLVRSLISIPAGYNAMPLPQFIGLSAIGTTIWCAILAIAGWVLGANWNLVEEIISRYEKVTLGLIAVAVILFIGWRVRTRVQSRPV